MKSSGVSTESGGVEMRMIRTTKSASERLGAEEARDRTAVDGLGTRQALEKARAAANMAWAEDEEQANAGRASEPSATATDEETPGEWTHSDWLSLPATWDPIHGNCCGLARSLTHCALVAGQCLSSYGWNNSGCIAMRVR